MKPKTLPHTDNFTFTDNFKIMYNFDQEIDRRASDSMKWKYMKSMWGREDLLPMWVADMDFPTPTFILNAIQQRLQNHPVLGYTCSHDRYWDNICQWNLSHYGQPVQRDEVNYVPGVVNGIFLALNAFTEKGDKVLIQQPVYHPFHLVPEATDRLVVSSPLRWTGETFEMDLDRLRQDVKGCRMMILCNPHNPAGICWNRETLQAVAEICHQAGVLVVSDEIHCDMVLGNRRHIPFASVSEVARQNSITLQAASKTFNMPGVVAAQAIVYNPQLRDRYFSYIEGTDSDLGNAFAYDCVASAYTDEGDQWRREMLAYVEGNIAYMTAFLQDNCPLIRPIQPQASFLVFLNNKALLDILNQKQTPYQHTPGEALTPNQISQRRLEHFYANEALLALNSGAMFGDEGTGFMRINLGCPRKTVEQAMHRLHTAYTRLVAE